MSNKNKKATIGATMTWVVATIIILFAILIFVYAAALLAEKKKLGFSLEERLYPQSSLVEQSLLAMMKTKIDGKTIQQIFAGGEQKAKSQEISNLLKKIPNCFTYNLGGAWEIKYSENGGEYKSYITYLVSASNLQFAKFNFVFYSEKNKLQIYEICRGPEALIPL